MKLETDTIPSVYTLEQLAEHVGGEVVGDSRIEISAIQPFENAKSGELTLALEKKYLNDLDATRASAVIVTPEVLSRKKPLLQVDHPKVAFARLLALFYKKPFVATGISPLAFIGQNCHLSDEVSLYPFVYVGDQVVIKHRVTLFPGVFVDNGCTLGEDCVLHPNVTLMDHVSLGKRVILHSGTVIGADGFGYVFDSEQHLKIPQTGRVIIHDDVEIGANSCVDRATFGETIIERGVKLDNHVHIGHNCRIGEDTVIVAQVGISGSVKIGKNCTFAGHSGVVDHVKIGDQVTVMMKTAISKDIASGSVVSGQPARDHRKTMRTEAMIRHLPEMYTDWKEGKAEQKKKNREED